MAEDVSLITLLAQIERAKRPVQAAYRSEAHEPTFDFAAVREALAQAHHMLGGDPEDLARNMSPAARRLRVATVVNFAAVRLMGLAQAAASRDATSEDEFAMLAETRTLARLLEEHLFEAHDVIANIHPISQARRAKSA
jgi:hypothetical protein